jgi:site-specific DNA recombinase
MGRAVIYCRISSDREGRALGVRRQEDDCRDLAARLGHDVIRIFQDNDIGASRHSKKRRPQFDEMVRMASGRQFDVIIAWSTSRLTRRPLEHELLMPLFEEHRIMIHTVKAGDADYTTARGRRRAREDAARDAEEVEEQSERSRRQKIQAAMAGEWRGGRRPYGYGLPVGVDLNGEPLIDCNLPVPVEADEIRAATRDLIAGVSLRSITAGMNARGRLTSTGRPFTASEVRRMLRRARNAGLVEIRREDGSMEVVAKAKWPAIVPEDDWRAVVAILSDPRRRTNRSNIAKRWLGSGLFMCGVCGGRMRATRTTVLGESGAASYRCAKTEKASDRHVARRAVLVDEVVTAAVLARLSRPDAVEVLSGRPSEDTAELRSRAKRLRTRLDEADDMFSAGELDRRRLAKISDAIRAELAEVEDRLAESASAGPLTSLVGIGDLKAAWDEFDVARRQAVVAALCEVVLHPGKRGRPKGHRPGERYFDPTSVEIRWRG